MPRFYCPAPLASGLELELPAGAARHVQVLRLQPGDTITLFHGGLEGAGPGGGAMAPTLPTVWGSLPPEGAQLALGRPGGGAMAPTLPTAWSSLPPEGAQLALGRPGGEAMAPTLPTAWSSLPPEGAQLALGRPGGEFDARITHMGRSSVRVEVGAHHAIEREAERAVHLVAGITANERMDWLVEKATELGAASITPLLAERSVLRLKGERADKKRAHWQAIAIAACEQCGRNRVPLVAPLVDLAAWLAAEATAAPAQRLLLSLRPGSKPLRDIAACTGATVFLSGPEGGLSPAEEDAALAHGFAPVTLGARVLRAETAALAALVGMG